MDLDRYRKDAKALHHAVQRGEDAAARRAARVLGGRAARRCFQLSDAQHVVAVELGYPSWPPLRATAQAQVRPSDPGPPAVELIQPGACYTAGDPARLRIVTRRWPEVDDGGGAVERAGRPAGWRTVTARVARQHGVNVNRTGVLSLPVVPCGPGRDAIVHRIAEASVVLFGELLELDGETGTGTPGRPTGPGRLTDRRPDS